MQIVGDQEDPAAAIVPDRRDQLVELGPPTEVHRLRGLVQHQQLRIAGKRARKQNALKFAAGQFAHLRIDDAFRACLSQAGGHSLARRRLAQRHEAPYRKRNDAIDRKALRHIADAQPRLASNAACRNVCKPEQRTCQCRLPSAVWADQRDDFRRMDGDADILNRGLASKGQRDALSRHKQLSSRSRLSLFNDVRLHLHQHEPPPLLGSWHSAQYR